VSVSQVTFEAIVYIKRVKIAMLQEVEATKEKQSVSLCDARLGIITTAKFSPVPASNA
jgi:hypothetical protein